MRWPLVLFALLVLLLGLGRALARRGRWAEALDGALAPFAVFAALAVLTIAFGKPGRLPQYAAWGVVAAQALRAAAAGWGHPWPVRGLDVLCYALLAFLWVRQSPLFDTLPP